MAKHQGAPKQAQWEKDFAREMLSAAIDEAIREEKNPDSVKEQQAILERLQTDKRMKTVWSVLLSRRRPSREFLNPAIRDETFDAKYADELQFNACRQLFYFVFIAARDKIAVSRAAEVKQSKVQLTEFSQVLRTVANILAPSVKTGAFGVTEEIDKSLAEYDAASLLRVAKWLDSLSVAHRKPGDPLMVKRHRGDSVVRGVQTSIAEKMTELFGKKMHQISATLASVALGKRTSRKVTRAAPKSKKSTLKGMLTVRKKRH